MNSKDERLCKGNAIVTPQIAREAANFWQRGEMIRSQGVGPCVHRDRNAKNMSHIQDFLSRV